MAPSLTSSVGTIPLASTVPVAPGPVSSKVAQAQAALEAALAEEQRIEAEAAAAIGDVEQIPGDLKTGNVFALIAAINDLGKQIGGLRADVQALPGTIQAAYRNGQ